MHKLDILKQAMPILVNTKTPDDRLRTVNNILTIAVVGLGLYLILMPLLPQLTFWIKQHSGRTGTIPYSSNLNTKSDGKPIPQDNRLVLPQIDLDAPVYDGLYASTLSKGIWHRPKSSTPDKGGNTVLVAHRFTYKSPAIFYHLDKINVNDTFALFWGGKEYDYKVREVRVVEPTETYIENSSTDPILTLYTCTPMWTSKQRLVVIADLIQEQT